jgi:hypothetical protein
MVGIGRTAFKIWLTTSIIWIIAVGITINAGGIFPAGFQTNFPLRADLERWNSEWSVNDPLRHPLYEIIRSPAAEKLPLTFQWRGYSDGPWNQHIHARDLPQFAFPGGETLDLPAGLTDVDREYVKQVFWNQRWKRWKETLGPFARAALFLPLGFFVVLWLVRRLKIMRSGKEPEPEAPRLPYSPSMERVRKATLVISGIEILFWLVIGMLNEIEEPQPLANALSVMFLIMLPAVAAFFMSLLRRGPLTAAALAGLALWMLLPQLMVRILPAAWLPG